MIVHAKHVSHILDELPDKFHTLLDDLLAFVDTADSRNRAFPNSNPKDTRFLLAYHLCKNTLLVTRDLEGGISGMALWYQFKGPWTWGEIDRWRQDDEDGKEIVFSHLIASTRKAREMIIDEMRKRVKGSDSVNVTALRNNRLIKFSTKNADRFRKFNRN
jgi:hypothetical protein